MYLSNVYVQLVRKSLGREKNFKSAVLLMARHEEGRPFGDGPVDAEVERVVLARDYGSWRVGVAAVEPPLLPPVARA